MTGIPTDKDASRVAAGAGLVTLARTVGGILNLLLIVVLTRLLSKGDFATVIAIYLVHELITAVGPLGLPSALSFFVPKLGRQAGRSLATTTSILLFAMGLPIALGLVFGGPAIADAIGQPQLGIGLAIISVAVLADMPGQTLPSYLIAKEAYIGAFWVTLLFYLTRFASFVVPAYLGYSPAVIIGCFSAVAVLRFLWLFIYLVFFEKGAVRRQESDQWSIGELYTYGLPMAASLVVGKLNIQLDKYMIFVLLTPAAFAVFTVGAIEIPLVTSIAYSVTTALIPTLVKAHQAGDIERFMGYWHGSMTKVASIMMPIWVFCMVFAEPIMKVIFSASYAEAAIPFRVYLCLLPLRLCGYGAVVRAIGHTKPVLWAASLGLLVNVVLNYPLYLLFGMPGPALASILAQVTAIGVLLRCIRRALNLTVMEVFPFASVLKALSVAIVSALPLWGVILWTSSDVPRLVTGASIYLITYLCLGLMTRVIARSDLVYLLGFLTGRTMGQARTLAEKEQDPATDRDDERTI